MVNSQFTGVLDLFLNAPAAPTASVDSPFEPFVVCSGGEIREQLRARGWSCNATADEQLAQSYGKRSYNARIEFLLRLVVKNGRDVLMSDLDALWLRDPLPLLRAHANAGIIGSRGSWPANALYAWGGSAFCMGFIFFRGTDPRVRALVSEVLHLPIVEDQEDLNRRLCARGVVWDGYPLLLGERSKHVHLEESDQFRESIGPSSMGTVTGEGEQPITPALAHAVSIHAQGRVRADGNLTFCHGQLGRRGDPRRYAGLRIAMLAYDAVARECGQKKRHLAAVGRILARTSVAHCRTRSHDPALKLRFLALRNLTWVGARVPQPRRRRLRAASAHGARDGMRGH
jgi:hypothetical protein